ncbi:MAG: PAS domain S-box protein [Gammaproteobacteria bacterium]|nr:PAS domain S-box protein [Gammaproteobacteria bacterium]
MQDSPKLKQVWIQITRTAISTAILWSILVATSLYWNINNIRQQAIYQASSDARSNWDKDQAFRQWATLHGGVYVKIDDRSQPSPYLAHLPHRDLKTTDGIELTLLNPAYMMRQMTEEFESLYGIKGKITSEQRLNPKNTPDEWELKALKSFHQQKKELLEQAEIDGEPYIRLMRPMQMTPGCIQCHNSLEYVPGNIHGGVSISIPLLPYLAASESTQQSIQTSHGLIWLLGLFGIGLIGRWNYRHAMIRHAAEAQLEQSEHEWNYAMDFLQDAIYLLDLDDKVVRANRAFYEITHLSPEQVIGQDITQIMHPQGEPAPCPVCQARKAHEDTLITMEADHPDNPIDKPIEILIRMIRNQHGNVTGILMGIHDLSRTREAEAAVRESEHQIRDLLESTAEAIYSLDLDGICTLANRACAEQLGYQNPSDLVGLKLHAMIHHSYEDGSPYPEHECPIHGVTKRGSPSHRDNEVFWRKDGSSFPVEYWAYPIYREHKLIGTVATFFNISERKQTEQILRRTQKMDALGQLTGGIAHDFNNQLGVVSGYLDFLTEFIGNQEKPGRWIDNATKATNRCIDLTRQLLAFSRKQQTDLESIDLIKELEEIKNLIRRSVTPVIEVNFSVAEDIWPLSTSPGDLQDAILNLAINARDAMPEGGHLNIDARNIHMQQQQLKEYDIIEGNYVQISIRDNGIGMSPEVQEHVFDPFYTTKDVGKGTGLGMAMVYGFVKRNAGYINLISELGEGTTVTIYIPAHLESIEQNKLISADSDLPQNNGETILLVEDEEHLGTLAEELLTDQGYRVISVKDGNQAIDALVKNTNIDLVFTDIVMPGGISGFELAKQARTIKPGIKVLLTSGFTYKDNGKSDQKQVASILDKPYTKAQLLQAIDRAMNTDD